MAMKSCGGGISPGVRLSERGGAGWHGIARKYQRVVANGGGNQLAQRRAISAWRGSSIGGLRRGERVAAAIARGENSAGKLAISAETAWAHRQKRRRDARHNEIAHRCSRNEMAS
jgi:hypothetical protein